MTTVGLRRVAASIVVALALCAPSARAETPAPSTDAAPAPEPRTAAAPFTEPAGSVTRRVVAEALVGSSLATLGYLAGPKVAGVACSPCLSAAGLAGASAAFPLGVYWGGRVVGGRGGFWLTVAAPWIVSASTFIALARDRDYDASPAFQIGSIGGAIAAPLSIVLYELTHATHPASNVWPTMAASAVQLTIGPHRDGMMMNFARTF